MRILDAFSGVGGAGMGYARAGFTVVGVDIDPQPDYPFTFHRGDAIEFIREHGHEFDAIHMSPPCQARCNLTRGTNAGFYEYPDLIDTARDVAESTGKRWILENVPGSGIRRDVTLCGEIFGLDVIRHRYFELGRWRIRNPPRDPEHRGRVAGWRHGVYYDGPYVAVYGDGGGKGDVWEWQKAMGIDWTEDRKSLAEAIPPAYTEWIGRLLRSLL
jgi:hypothetical protein